MDQMSPPGESKQRLPIILGALLFLVSLTLLVSVIVRLASVGGGQYYQIVTGALGKLVRTSTPPPTAVIVSLPALQVQAPATPEATATRPEPTVTSLIISPTNAIALTATQPPVPTLTKPVGSTASITSKERATATLRPTATPKPTATPQPTLRRPTRVPRAPMFTLTPTGVVTLTPTATP
jgi:hypothetical protein